jgi:hypothetical protein
MLTLSRTTGHSADHVLGTSRRFHIAPQHRAGSHLDAQEDELVRIEFYQSMLTIYDGMYGAGGQEPRSIRVKQVSFVVCLMQDIVHCC